MVENGDDIVISGIGGKFPESDNLLQLKERLFSKEDMVSDDIRFAADPPGKGTLRDTDTFDNAPFKMHSRLVRNTDPITTQTLERAFEAMVDAGLNPFETEGRDIAVISASMVSDSENTRTDTSHGTSGFVIMGHNRSMVSNRISYSFNLTGPSYSIITNWDGGATALDHAFKMISQGIARAAIVTTTNLIFFKAIGNEYEGMDIHKPGVRCHSFDDQADGTCRSESIVSFFVQRACDAKRNYASVVKISSMCLGQRACSFIKLDNLVIGYLREFYRSNGIDPDSIAYLEADGCGLKSYDSIELNALASIFFEKRKKPLPIGSIKSNLGNTESSSTSMGIIKSIIAMEFGLIPPNIHYSTPNSNVPALINGQFQPVTEATPLTGDLVSVSSLSLGGTVGHVLIRRNSKEKQPLAMGQLPPDGLHRLIMVSARHEEGITEISTRLQSMPVDVEYASMVNDVFKTNIPSYLWKSFVVLPPPDEELKHNIKKFDNIKRPIWYVFSGMGSQWVGMGRDLLRIPVFSQAVDKCDAVLRPRGIDIHHILTSDDVSTMENILNSFVGIATVQIGLVDILRTVGLEPDGMVGHSVGELGCAYADGCFTAEEMVLAAYARGKASLDCEVIHGMMAAVGVGYKDMCKRVPSSIDVACHNAADSCTLSGPTDDIIEYVKKLKQQNVFAKAVSAGNIAYHSRYIKPVAPKLLEYLSEVIRTPKARTSRWISSSVPEEDWASSLAQLSSAEYHTNNLLSPVLFEEACKHVPTDAIIIEIAPHGLLQAILRRSLNTGCTNIPLTNKNASSGVRYLLEAFGTLYLHNVTVDVNQLYPPLEYPVSRGTPPITPLITYDHHDRWFNGFYHTLQLLSNSNDVVIDTNCDYKDYDLWKEHCIDGQIVFPASLVLVYVWNMLFFSGQLDFEKEPIIIEDMVMSKQIVIKGNSLQLVLSKRRCTGNFGVYLCEDGIETDFVVTGNLHHITNPPPELQKEKVKEGKNENDGIKITKEEVLEILSHFSYELGPQFKAFKDVTLNQHGLTSKVEWTGNMITFLDSLFKLVLFVKMEDAGRLLYPDSFRKLYIDAPFFFQLEKGTELDVHYDSRSNIISCKGFQLSGMTACPDPFFQKKPTPLQWTQQCFVPFHSEELQISELLAASLQLVADAGLGRWQKKNVKILVKEIEDSNGTHTLVSKTIKNAINSLPHIHVIHEVVDIVEAKEKLSLKQKKSCLVIGGYESLQQLERIVSDNVFLLAHVYGSQNIANGPLSLANGSIKSMNELHRLVNGPSSSVNVLSKDSQLISNGSSLLKPILTHHVKTGEKLVLLKKQVDVNNQRVLLLEDEKWLTDLGHLFNGCDNGQPVVVVSRKWRPREILPLLAHQKYAHRLRCVFLDNMAPEFSLNSPLFYNQLNLGLAVSELHHKVWGFNCTLKVSFDSVIAPGNIQGTFISSDINLDINIVAPNAPTVKYQPDFPIEQMEIKYMDYCGTRGSGEKVMGLAEFDPVTNYITPHDILTWNLPSDWSMEEGATIPAAYALAYYCFHVRVNLEPGIPVLVHDGTYPVSQACIAVALEAEADVFVTVHSEDECSLLLQTFPQLKPDQLLPLEEFNTTLRRRNKAIKIVINCLQKSEAGLTLEYVCNDAEFFHLNRPDVKNRDVIGLFPFLKELKIHGLSLRTIFDADTETKTKLHLYIENGLKRTVVKPLKKRLFTMQEYGISMEHLKTHNFEEKTLILLKRVGSNKSLPSNLNIHCDPHESHIIVAPGGDFWLDVMEWLIHQGARKLLVAIKRDNCNLRCLRRLNRMTTNPKLHISVSSAECLETSVGALEFMKEANTLGPVSSVFCINMEENSDHVAHLDCASQLLVPQLKHFVCLFGGSARVCESRTHLGLSGCLIQSKSPLTKPQSVLPYLSCVLNGHKFSGYLFSVKESRSLMSSYDGDVDVIQDPLSLLPSTITDLLELADEISDGPTVCEIVSRSPPHKYVKHCLLPVFVIPGLHSECIKNFTRHLIHPAYCVSLPAHQSSVKSTAEALVHEILRIQHQSPYNILAESWSGALALELGVLLEAKGHQVYIFLADAAPSTTQQCARMLCVEGKKLFNVECLSTMLSLDSQKARQLQQVHSWEEQLEKAVQLSLEVGSKATQSLSKALTALWNHLATLLDYTPPHELFKGRVYLIRPKGAGPLDFCGLQVYCKQKPRVHVLDDDHLRSLGKNSACIDFVNQNLAYSWAL